MLVHICCSVDSHYFFKRLQEAYPKERLIGFFYNPNIHPYSEYELRLQDVKRSCDKLRIELIEGEYSTSKWFDGVKGLEEEREKGDRCDVCFDIRLKRSAQKALELNENILTTTLFMSPQKSFKQLSLASEKIRKMYKIELLTPDFRSNGGTNKQFLLAKKDRLYHQNYCGCMFALKKQRESQKKLNDEMFLPLGREILPNSIEDRLKLYKKVIKCEKKSKEYILRRDRFLNYRLLYAKISLNSKTIPSFILHYSVFKKELIKLSLDNDSKNSAYKDEVLFINLKKFNKLLKTEYKSVKELMFNAISVKKSLELRDKLEADRFSLMPIVVVDKIEAGKYTIFSNIKTYQDVREVLVRVR